MDPKKTTKWLKPSRKSNNLVLRKLYIRKNATKEDVAAARDKMFTMKGQKRVVTCNFCPKTWKIGGYRVHYRRLTTAISIHYKRDCKFLKSERVRISNADFSTLRFDHATYLNAFTSGTGHSRLPSLYVHLLRKGSLVHDVATACFRISYMGSAANNTSDPITTRNAFHALSGHFDSDIEKYIPTLWAKSQEAKPVRIAEAVMLIFLPMFPNAKNCSKELTPLFGLTCEEFSLVADTVFSALNSMTNSLICAQINGKGLDNYLASFDEAKERIMEKAKSEIEQLSMRQAEIRRVFESQKK